MQKTKIHRGKGKIAKVSRKIPEVKQKPQVIDEEKVFWMKVVRYIADGGTMEGAIEKFQISFEQLEKILENDLREWHPGLAKKIDNLRKMRMKKYRIA